MPTGAGLVVRPRVSSTVCYLVCTMGGVQWASGRWQVRVGGKRDKRGRSAWGSGVCYALAPASAPVSLDVRGRRCVGAVCGAGRGARSAGGRRAASGAVRQAASSAQLSKREARRRCDGEMACPLRVLRTSTGWSGSREQGAVRGQDSLRRPHGGVWWTTVGLGRRGRGRGRGRRSRSLPLLVREEWSEQATI